MADTMLATAAAYLSPQITLPQPGSSGRTNVAARIQKTDCRIGIQNRNFRQRNSRIGYGYQKLLQIRYCTSESRALSSSEEEDDGGGEEWEVAPLRSSDGIDVYVASMPLRSPKSVQWILRAADEADFGVDLQHFMTLIRPAGDGNDGSRQCWNLSTEQVHCGFSSKSSLKLSESIQHVRRSNLHSTSKDAQTTYQTWSVGCAKEPTPDQKSCAVNGYLYAFIRPLPWGFMQCTVLDFQPRNPEDPMTAVSVLIGRPIPGVLLERTLFQLPRRRCWWVGQMKAGLDMQDAMNFHRQYDSELSVGINDCRHHTLDLVEHLTGERMAYIEQVRIIQERKMEQIQKQMKATDFENDDEEEYGNPVLSIFSGFFRDLVDILTGKENMPAQEKQVQSVETQDSSTDQALQNEESPPAPAMLEGEAVKSEVSVKVSR